MAATGDVTAERPQAMVDMAATLVAFCAAVVAVFVALFLALAGVILYLDPPEPEGPGGWPLWAQLVALGVMAVLVLALPALQLATSLAARRGWVAALNALLAMFHVFLARRILFSADPSRWETVSGIAVYTLAAAELVVVGVMVGSLIRRRRGDSTAVV
ncbi:MAG: hypothetical protein AAGD35_05280 [Actinomycetota bacterium]